MRSILLSIRRAIRARVAPEHSLAISAEDWRRLWAVLHSKSNGVRESGAFLLGIQTGGRREVRSFVPYDELDGHCLDTGIVQFDGAGYSKLWDLCEAQALQVVGDVHTHPANAFFSEADRAHPMISQVGHVAIVFPDFAVGQPDVESVGAYIYKGAHEWTAFEPGRARRKLYIGWLA